MVRTQTMVQLTEELTALLDREAKRRGCSRSAVIREAVTEHLDRSSLDMKIARYVASYQAEPQGQPDDWGATVRSAPAFAGLAAEEEALGLSW